ncbi:MAG TPA: UbiA family prenyltransferase, partial [Candidatus Angelobacter sp.]|nr:UbiA family prenyltransferase [Candidatus Angelobacter sp.]
MAPAARVRTRPVAAAYLALTKPRIIELLLVTTVPTMILAADGVPSLRLVASTLLGGFLAAGGANALNMYVDRDIDRLMARTGHRPIVTGEVSPRGALVFGLVLAVSSVAWFALTTNLLAALLTALA